MMRLSESLRRKAGWSVICILLVMFMSCTNYPGYRRTKNKIYYQLQKIGEDTVKIRPGDYITVDLTYLTMEDSAFFNGMRKFRVTKPAFEGDVDECFMLLSSGDCAEFIIDADKFFTRTLQSDVPGFLKPENRMKLKADILNVQTQTDYEKEKEAFLSWIEDFGDYEKVILQQYIEDNKLTVTPTSSGIYYIPLQAGSGKHVELGDTVEMHYEGRFLNGKFFDSTVKRNQPFQFVYGTEWQVIKGLEEAVGMMREGDRSLFIMPSEMAFGISGSSTGIIPPYTSLIFEVEILKVSPPDEIY